MFGCTSSSKTLPSAFSPAPREPEMGFAQCVLREVGYSGHRLTALLNRALEAAPHQASLPHEYQSRFERVSPTHWQNAPAAAGAFAAVEPLINCILIPYLIAQSPLGSQLPERGNLQPPEEWFTKTLLPSYDQNTPITREELEALAVSRLDLTDATELSDSDLYRKLLDAVLCKTGEFCEARRLMSSYLSGKPRSVDQILFYLVIASKVGSLPLVQILLSRINEPEPGKLKVARGLGKSLVSALRYRHENVALEILKHPSVKTIPVYSRKNERIYTGMWSFCPPDHTPDGLADALCEAAYQGYETVVAQILGCLNSNKPDDSKIYDQALPFSSNATIIRRIREQRR